jgi:hypothetical protein
MFIGTASIFFLAFGIGSLVAAYRMKNALEFIMSFFSSSLIILISLVGIIYPALQIHALYNHKDEIKEHDEQA